MKLIRWYKPESHFGHPLLDDAFDRFFGSDVVDRRQWSPPVDVHEDADKLVVTAELPGLKKEEIEVSLHDGVLTLAGERKVEQREEGATHLSERFAGKFQRALTLPVEVEAGKESARYKDGVLTVTLPKAEASKPKKIELN